MKDNLLFKRIIAYFIDLLVISILVSLLSSINFLNPQKDKYNKALTKYNEYIKEMQASLENKTTDLDLIIDEEYIDFMYKLQYYSLSYTIIEIVVIILYFTLFSIFNNNQTIGKRLLKIKLVNSDNSTNIPIWKYIIRGALIPIFTNIILYNTIASIINTGIMFVFKSKYFFYSNIIVTVRFCAYCYIDIIVLLASKGETSLHDKITKTKVIEIVRT